MKKLLFIFTLACISLAKAESSELREKTAFLKKVHQRMNERRNHGQWEISTEEFLTLVQNCPKDNKTTKDLFLKALLFSDFFLNKSKKQRQRSCK